MIDDLQISALTGPSVIALLVGLGIVECAGASRRFRNNGFMTLSATCLSLGLWFINARFLTQIARWSLACSLFAGGWGLRAAPIELAEIENWEPLWASSGVQQKETAQGRIFRVASPSGLRETMANHARPGDNLLMADGTWVDSDLVFEGNGEPGKPITLRAETPGGVRLTGQSHLRIGGSHLLVEGLYFKDGYSEGRAVIEFRTARFGEAEHCRLTRTVIENYNPPDGRTSYHWIALHGKHNRIDHNRLIGMNHAGRMITAYLGGEPNYHRIDHNHFGPRTTRDPALRQSGGAIIMIGHSFTSMTNSRALVENNLFEECSGHGEIISNKSNENVYRRNTFFASAGALTLRHGNRCVVLENVFRGHGKPGTGGVRIINAGHRIENNYFEGLTGRGWTPPLGIMSGQETGAIHEYFPTRDSYIGHNTFVDCQAPVVILGLGAERPNLSEPPRNLHFANNRFIGRYGPVFEIRAEPLNTRWENNLVSGTETGMEAREGLRATDAVPPRKTPPTQAAGASWYRSPQ